MFWRVMIARARAAQKSTYHAELIGISEASRGFAAAPLFEDVVGRLPGLRRGCLPGDANESVAKEPGRMLLMVTLCRAMSRATPATKPVRPLRAPFDRASEEMGAFTEIDVMLTMRPKLRSIMPSTVALMSSIGAACWHRSP